MTETGTGTIGALVAAVSAISMALFGVDYYSLLWGLVGALLAVMLSEPMSRARAVIYTFLATLTGAILGNVIAWRLGQMPKVALSALCILGGLASLAVAAALLKAAPRLTEAVARAVERRIGGGKT